MRFFGPRPALMVVEPESLCWMTGRIAEARDGLTWAGEFARLPALRAVVRDDGTGLGKGVRLDNARRRAAGLPEFDDTLDVFHTLREGGRALRKTWGAASREPWSVPTRPRRDSTGAAARDDRVRGMARGEPAVAPGRTDSGIKPWPPRRPGSRPGRPSSSSLPTVA